MKNNFKHIFFTIAFIIIAQIIQAQPGGFEVRVKGKVVIEDGQQPIEFATVMLKENETEKPLSGTSTDANGNFQLGVNSQNFFVEVSFIGFESQIIKDITINDGKADLGMITLVESVKTLDEVEIRAEKSTTEFKLDKRVFNVGNGLE